MKLWFGKPFKKLVKGLNKKSGHNNFGRITSYHRGGGHKRLYRIIDFNRNIWNKVGLIKRIEYDPNRSAFIALVLYQNGIFTYNILINDLSVGDTIINDSNTLIKKGNTLMLKNIPESTIISNIELKLGRGAQLVRAAGCYAKIISKDYNNNIIFIQLPSKKIISVNGNCLATIGQISNPLHKFKKLKKAGDSRHLNRRPVVRGVAMNPVDHPHGGGEGKTSGGRCSVTPWGKLTKGKKTRNKKKK